MPEDKVLTPEQAELRLYWAKHEEVGFSSRGAATELYMSHEALRAQHDEALAQLRIAVAGGEAYKSKLERERNDYEHHLKLRLVAEQERDAALARERALREALTKYGRHKPECHGYRGMLCRDCDCGLIQVSATAPEVTP